MAKKVLIKTAACPEQATKNVTDSDKHRKPLEDVVGGSTLENLQEEGHQLADLCAQPLAQGEKSDSSKIYLL